MAERTLFDAFLVALPFPFCALDDQRHLLAFNESFAALLGSDRRGAVPGQSIDPLVASLPGANLLMESIDAALSGSPSRRRTEARRGEPPQVFDLHAVPLTFSDHRGAILLWNDCEREASAAAESARRFVQLVLDTIPQRVFWKDRQSVYVGCNQPFAIDAGLSSPGEVVGKSDFELSWKAYAANYRADDDEVMSSGRSKLGFEEPQPHESGGSLWLRTSKVPITDGKGLVVGVLGTYEDITGQRQAMEALRRSEAQLRALFEAAPDGIVIADLNGVILEANHVICERLGYQREELVGRWLATIDHPDHRHLVSERLAALTEIGSVTFESLHQCKSGSIVPVEVNACVVDDGDRRVVLSHVRDITERKEAERRLALWARVFEESNEGILITDADSTIVSVNDAFTRITGYSRAEAIGAKASLLKSGRHDDAFFEQMWQSLQETGQWSGEIWNRRRSGEVFPEWLAIRASRDSSGRITLFLNIFSDISARKADEERIRFLAHHDALTELPNRNLLRDRLQQALLTCQRARQKLAVIFLDLDRFKPVNDAFGHASGDRLLQQVAQRLRTALREGDTIARVGGDEFVIVLPGLRASEDAARLAEKCLEVMADPFDLDGHELLVTLSLGITVFPDDGSDPAELLRQADAAMYSAKENGRNNFQFFTADLNSRAFESLFLESQLRRAVELGQFRVVYQPQVALADESLQGVEAMIRWAHPDLGLVRASRFVPLAEERGLMTEISDWLVTEICRQNRAWQLAGLPKVPVAVNLTAGQFRRPDLVAKLTEIAVATGLDPRWLELEVTEGILMQGARAATAMARSLAALGVRLAIDDFGSGSSSIARLHRIPVARLKIDAAIVRGVPRDNEDVTIVRSILALAKTQGLSVVAEGVERAEQLEFLRAAGCDLAQGFYVARPLSPEEFVQAVGRDGTFRLQAGD